MIAGSFGKEGLFGRICETMARKIAGSFSREGLAGSGSGSATRWLERSQVHWAGRVCLDLDPINNGKKDHRFIR